ncbi:DEAD/DEAH box helicase [Maricaulis sp.]|uniref:DEAD/DEAH box helicase n=1 Tax=Maricaulis sp. TaxID=1486257 RepID=UPI003A93EA83
MPPLTKFADLGLAEPILRALATEGYESPTPIQAEFIPEMLAGRDLVGIAQTGTGKTAAFLLPILNGLADASGPVEPKCCRALILTPTRELAAQIEQAIRAYGRHVRFSVALVVGGSKPFPQIRALSRGVDIVVATPGRLVDHMDSGAIKLNRTTTLVLDEADQMLDLGFLPAVRDISAKLNFKRQTVLTSATMPKQIRALIKDLLKDPKHISVAAQSRPIEAIDQRAILCNRESKRSLLLDILAAQDMTRGIVFTRTKRGADRVHEHLVKYGLNAKAIHGDKSQGERTRALDGFRRGKVKILVATDVAARGIDVDNISHVVNYELPNVPEAYVHRIGRTARAGKTGVAISLVDNSEKHYLRDIERLIGTTIPKTAAGHVVELEGDEADAAVPSKPRAKPVKRAFQAQGIARNAEGGARKAARPAPRGKSAGGAGEASESKRREGGPAKPGRAGRDGGPRSDARSGPRGKPAGRDGDKRGDSRPAKSGKPARDGGKAPFKGGDRPRGAGAKGTVSKGGEGKIFKPRRPGSRPGAKRSV